MILTNFTIQGHSLVTHTFVETGTGEGDTLVNALGQGFSELHSVEVHPGNYRRGVERFARHANVHLHLGSSPTVLPMLPPAGPRAAGGVPCRP
jgi:hypothetical protein